jgi:hypothetical protein
VRIIDPVTVAPGTPGVDTILASTNVAEADAPAWTAGTYNLGTQRMYNHRVYEVLASPSTSDQPDVGAAKTSPTWLDLGATNRWRLFDGVINQQTTRAGTIAITLTPGRVVNSLALFNLSGTALTVTVTDPVEGVVYNRVVPLQDNSLIIDGYSYCFSPITFVSDVVLMDLPNYGSATIAITIDAGSDTAKCGEIVIGRQQVLGKTKYGLSAGIDSYSVKTRDAFGNFKVTPRSYSKWVDYDVRIAAGASDGIHNLLITKRDIPTVYVGSVSRSISITLGFFRRFTTVLSDPGGSDVAIEVEGVT